jgi:hypothetical protein
VTFAPMIMIADDALSIDDTMTRRSLPNDGG